MKSDIHSRIDQLMDALHQLLDVKVVDEEINELYQQYKQIDCTSKESLAAFEADFDIKLPADFRAFYERKNGSGYGFHVLYPGDEEEQRSIPFYLMSLDEIRETKRFFCEVDEKLEEHYSEEEIRKLDPEIKPFLFHKQWIPFATMAGGSLYIMLDFDPTEQGKYGQIIMYVHDPDFVYYLNESFEELLEASNRNLSLKDEIDY
ncbi:SMI1/KNR4 family protein [Paenibacillus sp. DCT19]|uniref:SMI1/KNR4 family protein n=1 Tax=Paenibacillus sp. DCT19 TaxID=2211212 RepID=UPI0034A03DB5